MSRSYITIKQILLSACALLLFSGCQTQSTLTYFQEENTQEIITTAISQNYQTEIIPDDRLVITVTSIDPNSTAIFNLPSSSYLAPNGTDARVANTLQTYLVSQAGFINFPVIGEVEAAGLSLTELEQKLTEKISAYVKDPIVNIQNVSFKITVLGEVMRPGTLPVSNERISILDALGMAGDLTIYGERENVLLIRETPQGEIARIRMDLTDPAIFASPYYYLQQNDVLYVEPNKSKQRAASYNQNKQYNISVISTIISALSVLTSMTVTILNQ